MRQMNNEFVIFQTQESAVMIYWFVNCCARQQEDLTLEVLFSKQYTWGVEELADTAFLWSSCSLLASA